MGKKRVIESNNSKQMNVKTIFFATLVAPVLAAYSSDEEPAGGADNVQFAFNTG